MCVSCVCKWACPKRNDAGTLRSTFWIGQQNKVFGRSILFFAGLESRKLPKVTLQARKNRGLYA